MKNYKIPTITEVKVQNASMYIPFISVLMLLILSVIIRKNSYHIKNWKSSTKGIAVVVIVFMILGWLFQWPVEVPFIKQKSFDIPEARLLITLTW